MLKKFMIISFAHGFGQVSLFFSLIAVDVSRRGDDMNLSSVWCSHTHTYSGLDLCKRKE